MKLLNTITLTDYLGENFEFETLETLEAFLENQYKFWMEHQNLVNQSLIVNPIIGNAQRFQEMNSVLNGWKPHIESWDDATFRNNFLSQITNNISQHWLWSSHPFLQKWIELNETSAKVADAFFEAIVLKTTSNFSSGVDYLQGYVIAYEYLNQYKTDINRRRNSEKKSILQLRDQLITKHDEIIENIDNFQKEVTSWKNRTEFDYSEWFKKQKTHFDDTVLSHSKKFHEQLSSWTEKQTNLESLYQEKLRLEPSAQYWSINADKLKKQGSMWARIMVGSILLGFVTFAIFFISWLNGEKTVLSLQNIEGILLFATIISCYAFLLKSVSKAMFSAFHLQRVSEESALLTNLYLSLKEGKNDDVESRKIILQALFSRSETGLLSGEHGPTMPSATEFINIIGKQR